MALPKRSTFLKAAELQLKFCAVHPGDASMWACINIEKVTGNWDLNRYVMPRECKAALKYFEKYFKPKDKNKNGSWWGGVEDNEARTLALLLCAEMLHE